MKYQNNNIAKVTKCTFHMESNYQFKYIVLPITGNSHPSLIVFIVCRLLPETLENL